MASSSDSEEDGPDFSALEQAVGKKGPVNQESDFVAPNESSLVG